MSRGLGDVYKRQIISVSRIQHHLILMLRLYMIIQILSLRNSLIILLMHRNAVLQRKMIILRNLSL